MTYATSIRHRSDGWVLIGSSLAVYPREDGSFSVGRRDGARSFLDIDTGFENQQAAIDQAIWIAGEAV